MIKVEGGEAIITARTPDEATAALAKAFSVSEWKMPVKIRMVSQGSTLDYKAVLHIWFRAMAEQFSARDKARDYTAQDMHDLMCHRFLGYTEARKLGSTEIAPALRTLTYPRQLDRGELYGLCRKIEFWCADVGVTLPENPSQYSEDKESGQD